MPNLSPQSLIEIVNQANGNKPKDGIPGDRKSTLGNPFDMQRNERLRDQVCDAYDRYFKAVVAGAEPVPTASQLAQELGLTLAFAWQRPSRPAFMQALVDLEQRQVDGKPSKIMCWCAPSRCHLDTVKAYLDKQRAQSLQSAESAFRAMPAPPERQSENTAPLYEWARYAPPGREGYECSTQGDKTFSALNARLRDGRTIEEAYQLDVKGYRVQGNDWRLGKGKPPLKPMPVEALYGQYKALWQQWTAENPVLIESLATSAQGKVLIDKFASTPISQARALADLLNERLVALASTPQPAPDRITSLTATQVFVFGSNTEGRHGAGAAKQAVAFGAEYGNPRGRQGQTYAIVTKDLTRPKDQQQRSVPLDHIESQITAFLEHAIAHPENEFLVTRFGCDLAGYSEQEIGSLWVGKTVPTNVRLPQAFLNVLQSQNTIAPETLPTGGVEAMPETTSTALAQPKPYNPLRDLAPLNARVAGPMQKDIAMGEVATQFIGRSAAPASTPSSTRNYEREWEKLGRANTGVYTAKDVVMISGSGPWRGVTHDQIQQTFRQHYEPLLVAVVDARATVVVGSAQGTDQLVQQWLQARGYKLSAEKGYMRVSPPVVQEKATTEGVEPITAPANTPTSLVVISGGQTGADFGGLKAGKALGLTTRGTAPHGWLVERCARFLNSTNPGLSAYGLVEGPRGNNAGHAYILRTELNVKNSDGTLVLGSIDPVQDKGSFRTVELAEKHSKPCLHVDTVDLFQHPNESVLRIKDWVLAEGIETLNVAGNRESKCPGLEDRVETVLKVALAEVVRVRTALQVEQHTTTNGDIIMTIDQTTPIVIACDGACSGNPGPGGFGTIVQYPDGTEEIIVGNALETTNNRMELQGLIEGLKAVYSNSEAALTFSENPVHVLTDSDLTIKCAEGAWKRKANKDLWQEYEQLPTSRPLTFEWVRGHNGHELNERCDKLAVEQSQLAKQGKASEPATVVQPAETATTRPPVAAPTRYPVYLSLVNGQLQQHATWPECQAATNGVSNSKYKKVKDESERTQILEHWGVPELAQTSTPVPARFLIYGDRECCPQFHSTDVQTKVDLLTQKAIKEAQKRGYRQVEVIVATINADPVNLECLQPLVAAAQTGVSKAQANNETAGNAPVQTDVYESTEAPLDLLDLQDNPDNRLILISNGRGLGTQTLVKQAESQGVKVIGYNPEKQEYISAEPRPAIATAGKGTKGSRDNGR